MKNSLPKLRADIQRIYQSLKTVEAQAEKAIAAVHPYQRRSATTLIHYLTLRRENLRPLQNNLHDAGLSSLASSEGHVLRQVQAVLQRLGLIFSKNEISKYDSISGTKLLQRRATALFGVKKDTSIPHIMVTFERSLANDAEAVKGLLLAGMNIARINCAHDSANEWEKMIANVHEAEQTTGRLCKIYLDLAGPKIRTILLGKGRKKGRLKLYKEGLLFLAETDANFDKKKKVVGCTLPGVVADLRRNDRVLFDDGLIETLVETPGKKVATLRVCRISSPKPFLKPEKGINFPDTSLTAHSLTEADKSVLPFASDHADLIGFSFVRSAADVAALQQLLRGRSGKHLPIILKIETFEAVQNLPELLFRGMMEPLFGVMIARGDLAVEIGFERLSEIQEEILWLCEAAQVPVIWATQVLETLNKSGVATRSEVTDAAISTQAECVMLNKGKYLLTVLATLQDILHRSGGHHAKKRYVFRPLKIAERFLNTLQEK